MPDMIALPAEWNDDWYAHYSAMHNALAGPQGALPVVAASTSSPAVKNAADYVCDGTDDQATINAALAAEIGNGAGGVQLVGGLYFTTAPIVVGRAQTLNGIGSLTEIRADSNFSGYLVENSADSDNMITISNLLLNGGYLGNVGGIKLINDSTSFPQSGSGADRPGTNPDSVHWIHHVYIRAPGQHGIYMGTSTGSTGNSRGNKVHSCRITVAGGDAVHLDAASDTFMMDVLGTTQDGSGGHGFHVGGGSTKLVMCKTAYTNLHGFNIQSSRAQLTGCSAQDSGGHGYYVGNDAHLTGCQADSNGRLQVGGGDGYYIASSDVMLEGCRALDRSQSPQRQRHGFNWASGSDVYITGQAYNNTGNKLNNSGSFAGGGRYCRISGGGSILSIG